MLDEQISDAGDLSIHLPGSEEHYHIDTLERMDVPPRPELLAEIGWRKDVYEFEFFDATIFGEEETPTSSRIEVAFSRQLGGAYVMWFSGVSSLEAPDICSYGWIDCAALDDEFDKALFKRSLLRGAYIVGYASSQAERYYAFMALRDARSGECHAG